MKMLELYASILNAAGFVVDGEGYVSVNNQLFTGEANTPATISEQRLVLPTDDHLRASSNEKILFHPLREQAMHGESKVFVKFREALTTRLSFTFAIVVNSLIGIAKSVGEHKHLSPDQCNLLLAAKDVGDDTHLVFSELYQRAAQQGNAGAFVNIFMKKSGVVNGETYLRVGVVSFPFYEELAKEQDKYFGMSVSKKERANLLRLMEYVMPGLKNAGQYNRGSNSNIAPFLSALMDVFGAVAGPLNDQITLFASRMEEQDKVLINSDWVDSFTNLDRLLPEIRNIPVQAGNEGATPVSTIRQVALAAQTPAVSQPVQQQAQAVVASPVQHVPQQVVQHQPQPSPNGTIKFSDLMNSNPRLAAADAVNAAQLAPMLGFVPGMPMPGMVVPQPGAPRSNWNAGAIPAQMPMPGYGQPMYPGQMPMPGMPMQQMPIPGMMPQQAQPQLIQLPTGQVGFFHPNGQFQQIR